MRAKKSATPLALTGQAAARGPASPVVAVRQWVTPEGMRVNFLMRRELPIVDLAIDFEAGSAFDPPGKSGVAELTAALLLTGQRRFRGVPAMNEDQAENAFDDLGAKVIAEAHADRLSVALRAVSVPAVRDHAMALLCAMLAAPVWATQPFERERERMLAFAEEQASDPELLSGMLLTQSLYAKHPFGTLPDAASIQSLERADVAEFHRTYLTAPRATLTVVGDLDQAVAECLAEWVATALPPSSPRVSPRVSPPTASRSLARTMAKKVAAPVPAIPMPVAVRARQRHVAHPASQAYIAIGALTPGVAAADFHALIVANRMFSWRLNDRVRDRLGLAYEVSSVLFSSRFGEHRIVVKTRRDQAAQALTAIDDTLSGFVARASARAEFERTRTELLDGRALSFDSNAKLLRHIADSTFDGLTPEDWNAWGDRIAAVKLSEAVDTFHRYIRRDRQIRIIVAADKEKKPPPVENGMK